MSEHDLKTWPEPFAHIRSRMKKCEVRKDDRGYAIGDTLRLREFEPCVRCLGTGDVARATREERNGFALETCHMCSGKKGEYTRRVVHALVTHVQRGFGLPPDLVVLSIDVFMLEIDQKTSA